MTADEAATRRSLRTMFDEASIAKYAAHRTAGDRRARRLDDSRGIRRRRRERAQAEPTATRWDDGARALWPTWTACSVGNSIALGALFKISFQR